MPYADPEEITFTEDNNSFRVFVFTDKSDWYIVDKPDWCIIKENKTYFFFDIEKDPTISDVAPGEIKLVSETDFGDLYFYVKVYPFEEEPLNDCSLVCEPQELHFYSRGMYEYEEDLFSIYTVKLISKGIREFHVTDKPDWCTTLVTQEEPGMEQDILRVFVSETNVPRSGTITIEGVPLAGTETVKAYITIDQTDFTAGSWHFNSFEMIYSSSSKKYENGILVSSEEKNNLWCCPLIDLVRDLDGTDRIGVWVPYGWGELSILEGVEFIVGEHWPLPSDWKWTDYSTVHTSSEIIINGSFEKDYYYESLSDWTKLYEKNSVTISLTDLNSHSPKFNVEYTKSSEYSEYLSYGDFLKTCLYTSRGSTLGRSYYSWAPPTED